VKTESDPAMVRVIGGAADGLFAPAKSKWGPMSIDPTGHGRTQEYALRNLDVHGKSIPALVLIGLSEGDAVQRYLALLEQDADQD
jgi:hypothetical protein